MEAQRGVVSYPWPHGLEGERVGAKPRPSGLQSLCSFLIALYGFLLPLQSFIQQWLTEPFLCPRHCAKLQRYIGGKIDLGAFLTVSQSTEGKQWRIITSIATTAKVGDQSLMWECKSYLGIKRGLQEKVVFVTKSEGWLRVGQTRSGGMGTAWNPEPQVVNMNITEHIVQGTKRDWECRHQEKAVQDGLKEGEEPWSKCQGVWTWSWGPRAEFIGSPKPFILSCIFLFCSLTGWISSWGSKYRWGQKWAEDDQTNQGQHRTAGRAGRGRARAAPGTALSGSWGSKAIRDQSLSHLLIHSTNIYWVPYYEGTVLGTGGYIRKLNRHNSLSSLRLLPSRRRHNK